MKNGLQVKQLIIEEFMPDSDASALADDLDLFDTGIIDSLGVLKLIACIENQLNLSIDAELIDQENFRTVAAIEALIVRAQEVVVEPRAA